MSINIIPQHSDISVHWFGEKNFSRIAPRIIFTIHMIFLHLGGLFWFRMKNNFITYYNLPHKRKVVCAPFRNIAGTFNTRKFVWTKFQNWSLKEGFSINSSRRTIIHLYPIEYWILGQLLEMLLEFYRDSKLLEVVDFTSSSHFKITSW